MRTLPDYIEKKYYSLQGQIRKKLSEYEAVSQDRYFYELCFCICTPQSKAKNALAVQLELEKRNFFEKPFDASNLLRENANYIRFHNTKAERLLKAREIFPKILSIINSDLSNFKKRDEIAATVDGLGMKEASHFLRNIGYKGLAILDRHILKHLVLSNVYDDIPSVSSKKRYLAVEKQFILFADEVKIPIDELDLLFWSYETGELLK